MMAVTSLLSNFVSRVQDAPLAFSLSFILVLLTLLWHWAKDELPHAGFPVVGKEKGEWLNTKAKMRYIMNAKAILRQGLKDHKGPFQVFASHGPVIVLPPNMIDEIRNDDRLSFLKSSDTLFMPQFSGLEPFHSEPETHKIFLAVIKQSLTQSLNAITGDLAKETHAALTSLLVTTTINDSWTPIHLALLTPTLAARLSAKAFLGEPLCRDPDWLDISVTYTINAMQAIQQMRQWPAFLRPLVHRFLPEFGVVRAQLATARRLIEPEIERRRVARTEEEAGGGEKRRTDALEWMEVQAQGRPFDRVLAQVLMSFVSIHTTSGTLLGLVYDVVSRKGWVDALREEVVGVLREEGGWTKAALYKMRLMDSCLKESQRLHPMNALFMNREVTTPVRLSDGTRLPKGALVGVPTFPMNTADDEWSFYADDPETFNGRRFLELRENNNDSKWQFVTTSPEHFGFGHGKQACPGRFFASNEIKIMMAHMLLMFDWKFEERDEPKSLSMVQCEFVPDVAQRIWVRPRVPELDLAAL